jgi:hypothetical protein
MYGTNEAIDRWRRVSEDTLRVNGAEGLPVLEKRAGVASRTQTEGVVSVVHVA